MSEAWGPWIEHDGRGCPVAKGVLVNGIRRDGSNEVWRAMCWNRPCPIGEPGGLNLWEWADRAPVGADVLRYRIRLSPGLRLLREIARNCEPHFEDA